MNLDRFEQAQEMFLSRYPLGFEDPAIEEIAAKHKLDKMAQFFAESFSKERFGAGERIVEDFGRMITRSSLVSVFEKTAMRNLIKNPDPQWADELVQALRDLYLGEQAVGFERVKELLEPYKLAKWPVVTVGLLYQDRSWEVFVKPTTVKGIIKWLDLEDLNYVPRIDYGFYSAYRERFNAMRELCDPVLSRDNAMLSGFLMMAMDMMNGLEGIQ